MFKGSFARSVPRTLSRVSEESGLIENSWVAVSSDEREYHVVEEPRDALPYEISARIKGHFHRKPMVFNVELSLIDNYNDQEEVDKIWELNYKEAAIYLEEGLNNEKFLFHPRDRKSLAAYRFVHNNYYYCLDLFASILLLCLSLIEKPGVLLLEVSPLIHAPLEILCLAIISVELWMKLKWMGLKPFITHPRTLGTVLTLIVMTIEASVVLFRQKSHFRIIRALRPVFLVDTYYCSGTRRTLRHLCQSLPPILVLVVLLLFLVLIFSLAGFHLFITVPNNTYFATFGESFASLFVVITNGNFPDVMMPVYAYTKWSAIFFIIYLVIQLYLILNMMLAVAYDKFSSVTKEKFHKLLIHRRKACQKAFRLLVSEEKKTAISFKHFTGVVKVLKPGISRLHSYLIFKSLDSNKSGLLSLNQFYGLFDATELSWDQTYPEIFWSQKFTVKYIRAFVERVDWLVNNRWFENGIDVVTCVSLFWEVFVTSSIGDTKDKRQIRVKGVFISIYAIEALLKLIAFGPIGYVTTGWNPFDFIVTAVAVLGHFVRPFGLRFGFFYVVRSLHILKMFERTQRYKDIMSPFLFIIIRQLRHFSLIIFIVLYSYAILGLELFSAIDIDYPPPVIKTTISDYYGLNNFQDIISGFMTLFSLMVGYTWFFLMDRYAKLAGPWSRTYFMAYYIISLIVLTIVVASILEAFVFKMHCKYRFDGEDNDETVDKRDVTLRREELKYLGQNLGDDESRAIFRGKRIMTKFSFSLKMYSEEVKKWIKDEEIRVAGKASKSKRRSYSAS